MATKVQVTVPLDNNNFADFKGWAGDVTASPGTGTGIASALQQLGFTKLSDTYTAQWDTGTSVGATALPIAAGNLFGAAFPTTTANARAQLAGTHFLGAWASGSYVVGDVVTYATTGLVYICIATATTQNPTDTTKWSPYWMEIWRDSSGTLTHFYIKLEYGGGATATNPQLSIQIGSAYSANSGVLSGNVSDVEQCMSGTGTFSSLECDFSGDGSNYFGMILARSAAASTAVYFERSINGQAAAAPVYTSAYVSYGKIAVNGATTASNVVFLSGGVAKALRIIWWATISMSFAATTLLANNTTPALPIFPLLGYAGNPVTAMVALSSSDAVEGSLINSTVYGSLHTYLVTKGLPGFGNDNSTGPYALGMRYE